MRKQRTLQGTFPVEGIALHGGEQVVAHLHPAPVNSGVQFQVDGVVIPARYTHVIDTQLATTLGKDGAKVRMVEHLLATLYGLAIDNVLVVMEGAELPVLDGCAAAWCGHLSRVGVVEQDQPIQRFFVEQTVEVRDGNRWARIEPATSTELDVTIDFDHPSVGRQHLSLVLNPKTFESELSWARTFGFERLVPAMQRMGLVRGGSLDNALVFGDEGPLNTGGLRAIDEPVRHKMLDALGDLALVGHPVCGRLTTERPGHGITFQLVQALLSRKDSWKIR